MPAWLHLTFGALLGLGGLAVIGRSLFLDRPRGRRRCPRCWYDMSGTSGLTCPECGREARRERQLFRTHRRWRWAAVGFLLIAGSPWVAFGPAITADRLLWLVPTRVWVTVLPAFDEECEEAAEKLWTQRGTFSLEPDRLLRVAAAWNAAADVLRRKTIATDWIEFEAIVSLAEDEWPVLAMTLLDAARTSDQYARRRIARALGEVVPAASPPTYITSSPNVSGKYKPRKPHQSRHFLAAVRTLKRYVETDPEPDVRHAAIRSLIHINPWPDILPTIVHALDDEHDGVRRRAAQLCGRLAPDAAAAVPELCDLVGDSNGKVREEACRSLGPIGMAESIPSLIDALENDGLDAVRRAAAQSLDQIAPADPRVVRAMIGALHDRSSLIRIDAVRALEHAADPQAIEHVLVSLGEDDNGAVRCFAAVALVALAPGDEQVIRALGAALHDDHRAVRIAAARHLESLGSAAALVRADLEHATKDANREIAEPAARALATIDSRR